MVPEFGSEDMVRRHDAFEGRHHDFLRRGGNDIERILVAADFAAQRLNQARDVLLQADPLTRFDKMLPPDTAELGIVAEEISEFGPLLYEANTRKTGDFLFKVRNAQHLGQDETRIVEAQRLVKVACN
jgi:hypothetical protein